MHCQIEKVVQRIQGDIFKVMPFKYIGPRQVGYFMLLLLYALVLGCAVTAISWHAIFQVIL